MSAAALERGVIARAMPHGDILGFAPPLITTRAEVDEIVKIVRAAVDDVANQGDRHGSGRLTSPEAFGESKSPRENAGALRFRRVWRLPGSGQSGALTEDGRKRADKKSGRIERPRFGQRVAIYIVISKPKRISVKLGVSHFIKPPCAMAGHTGCVTAALSSLQAPCQAAPSLLYRFVLSTCVYILVLLYEVHH